MNQTQSCPQDPDQGHHCPLRLASRPSPATTPRAAPRLSAFVISGNGSAAQPRVCDPSRCWPLGPPALLLCSVVAGTGRRPVGACTCCCERVRGASPPPCLRGARFFRACLRLLCFQSPAPPAFRDRCSLLSSLPAPAVPSRSSSSTRVLPPPLLTLPWLPSTPGLDHSSQQFCPDGSSPIVCHPSPGSSPRPLYVLTGPALSPFHPPRARQGQTVSQPLRPLAVAWTLGLSLHRGLPAALTARLTQAGQSSVFPTSVCILVGPASGPWRGGARHHLSVRWAGRVGAMVPIEGQEPSHLGPWVGVQLPGSELQPCHQPENRRHHRPTAQRGGGALQEH